MAAATDAHVRAAVKTVERVLVRVVFVKATAAVPIAAAAVIIVIAAAAPTVIAVAAVITTATAAVVPVVAAIAAIAATATRTEDKTQKSYLAERVITHLLIIPLSVC